MPVTFQINYKARWGQTLCLLLYSNTSDFTRHEMNCRDESEWSFEMAVNEINSVLRYKYAIQEEGEVLFTEFGDLRTVELSSDNIKLDIIDHWRIPNGDTPFNTVAFTEVFFSRKKGRHARLRNDGNLIFRLRCPQVEPNRHIAIVGNQKALGDWDEGKKIRMDESEHPFWSVALSADELSFPIAYKYLLVDSKTNEVVAWDEGANRSIAHTNPEALTVVTDEHFVRTVPPWKAAGTAIPVFSLRSEQSFGTGDFMDLKLLIDWAKQTGQRFIQILPINDTILSRTNLDSYPYNAVSVYALHPIYLRLENMGILADKQKAAYFEKRKDELNKIDFSDYQQVLNEKWHYFKLIFEQESSAVFQSKAYRSFFADNQSWLVPYAVFSYLRDKYGSPDFNQWPAHNTFSMEEVEMMTAPDSACYSDISFFYFLQFHLHRQLIDVHSYAHKKGIALKSDVPIGVSPHSVDAWMEPHLFNTTMQAGAPPDDFSPTGQNWGFPTYNWDEMAKDGYQWWKKRFRKFAEYFDAYRIDHILGFFRIWEIPDDAVWALTGNFSPSLPLSMQELQLCGLWWDEERYLQPYLRAHVVHSVFGSYAEEVIRTYLLPDKGEDRFKFKPQFDTQKKVENHFASMNNGSNETEKIRVIRNGLYALHCEVLFVRDKRDAQRFHPRVGMHASHTFRDLDEETKSVLDKIYIDYFYHRHNAFWETRAMEKLPAIVSATDMLICGEDLGMVPQCVPEVMQRLELLSLEIQRMPKNPNAEFAMPADAPYLSVCTTSTHDMNPIRAWWEEDEALTQRFYNYALGMQGNAPKSCLPPIAEKIIEQHLQSSAMLVILPWQDWLAMDEQLRRKNPHDERINVPANPRHFWCYRMHLTLEQLIDEKKFNGKVRNMIRAGSR